MVAYDGRPALKLSPGKQTLPGPKQTFRRYSATGFFERDEIAAAGVPVAAGAAPLLSEVMRDGRELEPRASLRDARQRFQSNLTRLPDAHKRLTDPAVYPVTVAEPLRELSQRLAKQTKAEQCGSKSSS